MENTLIKLKAILNGLPNEELEKMELWIDNDKNIEVIAVDRNAISLITDEEKLRILQDYLNSLIGIN